tara:strand:+ start:235 stop:438 length:204 start_codon:yes stop_codon:yes gene_type:complete
MAALEKVGAAPEEVLHVGDQVRSDVMGAEGVGMKAVLIDRSGHTPEAESCLIISSLSELTKVLEDLS